MNTENKTSYCTLCREPQTETQNGFQCRNGHLGAGSIPAVYGNDDEIADWGNLTTWLTLGKALHPLTINLVVRFAKALSAKLADAETKYGYSDGWKDPHWMDGCRTKLMEAGFKKLACTLGG